MKKEYTDRLWLTALSECNEVQRRRLAGVRAVEVGRGGLLQVCRITGMSHHTVIKGMKEVRNIKGQHNNRLKRRRWKKKIIDKNPNIKKEIENILEENTAGDPMSRLKWTNKSTYTISDALKNKKQNISEGTVGSIIKNLGYSLQANVKSKENGSSEERDSQFRYINEQVKIFEKKNMPVISVDTKRESSSVILRIMGENIRRKEKQR